MSRGVKGCIVLHPLNKFFTEYDDTFHTSACDLTVWRIYWVDGVRCNLSYFFSMWPRCIKYLLSGRSMMTPFIPLLTVTSLTEVFIEWMEYDDTFHTSAHCDLTVWSIYWRGRVSLCSILSINTSYSEVTSRGVKGVIMLHPLNKYFIQWGHNEQRREWSIMTPFTPLLVTSLYEIFIERMEHNDTLHTSACDLIVWRIYWENAPFSQ
jgi:hypothetical protein